MHSDQSETDDDAHWEFVDGEFIAIPPYDREGTRAPRLSEMDQALERREVRRHAI